MIQKLVKNILIGASLGLKQRVLFALIYSAGLRAGEVCRLKINDIDSDRMMIRIIKSKGIADRYVPLSPYILKGLRKYVQSSRPKDYLFNGRQKGKPLGTGAVQQAFRLAVEKAGIIKKVSVHTLRHSYATHLLDEGVDIVTIQELLGHSNIETSMMYLHVAKNDRVNAHSPLDTLYAKEVYASNMGSGRCDSFSRKFLLKARPLPYRVIKTLKALRQCRTQVLGGHKLRCNRCREEQYRYNSCRNRHCPKCQGVNSEKWKWHKEQELLPVPYFHIVFTLPSDLNSIAMHKPKEVYNSLFRAAWETINQYGYDPKHLGAKAGMTAVLHTWGQNLSLHPHLHCIVPGGGLKTSGEWISARSSGKPGSRQAYYLFPGKALAKVFRAKFMAELRGNEVKVQQRIAKKLFSRKRVVYAKRPF